MAHPNPASVAQPAAEPQALQRRLGPLDAAAIIVSNVIGGGILFTPPQVAAAVPNPYMFLGTWVAGGLLAFAGAMAYAELAALRPRAGGEYVYLRAAFGRLAAFLTGLDVVRRRLLRRHRRERGRPRVLRRPVHPGGRTIRRRCFVIPLPLRAADVLAPGDRRARRDLPDGLDPPARRRARAGS